MFRFHLFILFFGVVSLTLNAQNKTETERIKEKMWAISDAGSKETQVPEKWKNESAVILYRNTTFEYRKEPLNVYLDKNLYIRERVKLMDKVAVKAYSEFSFKDSQQQYFYRGDKVFMGIKVIKPNGREKEIDIDEAAVMQMKQGAKEQEIKKIAIPNLEPGDIIDYYYCTEEVYRNNIDLIFTPVFYPLVGEYPILKQKLSLNVMRKCYLNYKTINQAPNLELEDDKGNNNIYSLVDEHRDKIENIRWYYPYREVPTIKFQVFYARKKTYLGAQQYLVGKPQSPKNKLTQQEIIEYVTKKTAPAKWHVYKNFQKYLKFKDLKKAPVDTKLEEFYYYLRQYYYFKDMEAVLHIPETYYAYYPHVSSFYTSRSTFEDYEENFVSDFVYLLKKYNIDYEIVITTPRYAASIDEVISANELRYMIKINTASPFYIAIPDFYSNYKEIPSELEGSKAYLLNVENKNLRTTILPITKAEENAAQGKIHIVLDKDNMNVLKIKRENVFTGQIKKRYERGIINSYDILYQEAQKYKFPLLENMEMRKKQKKEVLVKIAKRKEEEEIQRKEWVREDIQQDFNQEIKEFENFELLQTGTTIEKPEIIVKDAFTIEGFTKKVAKNYLLEVGKLIGSQIALEEKEKKRSKDIYMPYARSFVYDITIEIPSGYEVQGIENLNLNNTNETGGFVSSAKIQKNNVIIHSHKYYNHHFEKSKDWEKMVEFLEAAYNFTQQKLLFKKIIN